MPSDIADHPEFADRKTTKIVAGKEMSGYFAIDFTYEGKHCVVIGCTRLQLLITSGV